MVASWKVKEGPVLDVLAAMPAGSVHAAITSPPYYGLRAYDGDQVVDWPAVEFYPMPGLNSYMAPITIPAGPAALGGESDPMAYIGHLVLVGRALRRVLRGDGLLWLNLGDSFAGSGGAGGDYAAGGLKDGQPRYNGTGRQAKGDPGLKPKDLIGIPSRAALALQADGWYWRSSAPWVKRNGMPDSAGDRPGSAVEWVHLLAPSRRVFYDWSAVELPAADQSPAALQWGRRKGADHVLSGQSASVHRDRDDSTNPAGRRRRNSDWWFDSLRRADAAGPVGAVPGPDGEIIGFDCTVASFPGAHFATWPPAPVEPMILASTSARGVCLACGAPWVRVTEKIGEIRRRWSANDSASHDDNWRNDNGRDSQAVYETTDWRPSCKCIKEYEHAAPVPAVVLDPFSGSGTTGAVAVSLGRRYIGIELSSEYAAMSRDRIGRSQPSLFGL